MKTPQRSRGGEAFEPSIAAQLPDDGAVLLLDPRLIVLAVGTTSGQLKILLLGVDAPLERAVALAMRQGLFKS